jgi:hypothetical protein
MLYTTCHDWLIDNSLLHKELAECKDVSGSVQVRVQSQPAFITGIPDSFSIGLLEDVYILSTANICMDKKEYIREWTEKNRNRINKRVRDNYKKDPEKVRKYKREWYDKNKSILRPVIAKRKRELLLQMRQRIVQHYLGDTPKCPLCGFAGFIGSFTIDHKNGGGRTERQKIGQEGMMRKIIKENFPNTYQVICANCNQEKRIISKNESPSYYVGTAGNVSAETIQKYIQNQKGIKAIPPPNKLGGPLA